MSPQKTWNDKKPQKYIGRVVFRGDAVKDDSGFHAVFTEQGSSASHMTAAKVLDVISRLPDCAGEASDAVWAYTQVKMEDTPKQMRWPDAECPEIWILLLRSRTPQSSVNVPDPVGPLE